MLNGISVNSSIVVVPYEGAEYYFDKEIKSEGSWRDTVELIALLPEEKKSEPGAKVVRWAFDAMNKSRTQSTPKILQVDNNTIDIGLIDIQIHFHGNQEQITALLQQNGHQFFTENARHLDYVSNGNIHDQMILINALHIFNSKGEIAIHYHNIIFGSRVEGQLVGTINLEPILIGCSEKRKSINVVAAKH